MENSFSQNINQKLTVSQQLSPRQYQALELLASPTMELENRINLELARNPVLELDSVPGEVLSGDLLTSGSSAELAPDTEGTGYDRDDGFAELAELADGFSDLAPAGSVPSGGADDEKHQFQLNLAGAHEDDFESPAMQLRFSDADPETVGLALRMLDVLDDRGYLKLPLADFAMSEEIDMKKAGEVLALVQSLEPAGIGARDLAECLMLQLRRSDPEAASGLPGRLITEHLDDVLRNRIPAVARRMKLTVAEVEDILKAIRRLSPSPLKNADKTASSEIFCDFKVVPGPDGELLLSGRDRWLPRLHISRRYLEMAASPDLPPDAAGYLERKIQSAKELFEQLRFRYDTLYRITEELMVLQRDFFFKGLPALRPLTMKQVADRLDIHETTVSRAVNGKYVKTLFGAVEYRSFFTGGYRTGDGGEVSTGAVMEKLREIVAGEDPSHPLSDDAIASALADAGFQVARRTVAKYRTRMGILPTNLRRKH